MPSYLIVASSQRRDSSGAVDALLCDPSSATGAPDKASGVPVRAVIGEQTITIDDEPSPRAIVSSVGHNGVTKYLLNGGTSRLRNRERRVALARASGLLQQLRSVLLPLIATSEESGAIQGLQLLFDWIRDERELAAAAPRSAVEGDRDHA